MKKLYSALSGDNRTRDVLLVLVVSVLLWEAAVAIFQPPLIFLPPPSAVWAEFMSSPGVFLKHMGYTLSTTAVAFALSVILGVFLAVCIVQSPFLERTVYTLLVALNSVPKVALAPLFVIWLGVGVAPKLAVAIMLAIFPIVIDTVLGLRSVEPDMISLAKTSRASRFQVLMKIQFPNALPSLFAGMKVAVSFALVGAIVGEFVAGGNGLGFLVLVAQGQFDTTRVFVSLVLLGLMGTILFYAVDFLERLMLPWHVSQRGHRPSAAPVAAGV
ncbi:putative aliphatic sulfonates transport permease protein SsuC [Antarctobacter heliothermus]|uniref:Putative aliphatic sulfonates transport permease protein SsuC n=1 Tax=Antarctobacter heliothermus TaxID=74033 RepID=A0A222E2J9_9RHOB|nr:ABC transporter permease [Antarctobacter heliothermus]ASP20400.1 putative aliphatic sulfonates transport permease protein SsuC [Antarctobacter heliothermus]